MPSARRRRGKPKLILWLALLALCAGVCPGTCGVFMLATGIEQRRNVIASQEWPVVPGRVVGSEVTEHRARRGRRGRPTYSVQVTYDYTASGQARRGTRYSYGDAGNSFSSRPEAERFAARYRPGAPVAVRCDPADPSRAVLVPGGLDSAEMGVWIGAVFCAAAVALAAAVVTGAPRAFTRLAATFGAVARTGLTKAQHLENLVAVALADGELSTEEEAHLEELAELLDLGDVATVRAALVRGQAAPPTFHVPATLQARFAMFGMLVQVAQIDGRVAARERRLLEAFAERLEIPTYDRDRMIGP